MKQLFSVEMRREISVEAEFHYTDQPLEKVRRGKAADQKRDDRAAPNWMKAGV
jgi:hypothetical protein